MVSTLTIIAAFFVITGAIILTLIPSRTDDSEKEKFMIIGVILLTLPFWPGTLLLIYCLIFDRKSIGRIIDLFDFTN